MGLMDRMSAKKVAKKAAQRSIKDARMIRQAIAEYVRGDCTHHEIMQWFVDHRISRAEGQAMLDEAVK